MAVRYRHYNGGIYELVCEATMESDQAPIVVYRAPVLHKQRLFHLARPGCVQKRHATSRRCSRRVYALVDII